MSDSLEIHDFGARPKDIDSTEIEIARLREENKKLRDALEALEPLAGMDVELLDENKNRRAFMLLTHDIRIKLSLI